MLAHPNGREMGEGAYVMALDNLGLRQGSLLEWLTTNVAEGAVLTRAALEQSFAWMIWRL